MKQIALSFLLCLMAMSSMAQKRGSFSERLFNAKVAEITYQLHLTEKQEADFRPIYMQYNKDMIDAWGADKETEPAKSSEEAAAQVKRRIERQQRAQEIRLSYTDKFATVLSPNQLQRFYKVENSIQKRLRERKFHKSSGITNKRRKL